MKANSTEDSSLEDVQAEFVVGTYQEFLIGYKLIRKVTKKGKEIFSLKQSFTNHSHGKSIRSLATVGKYVASGSADETIQLINLQTRAEHGCLQPHTGTISCLTSFGSEFLFSGSQDGSICIWKNGSWRCEKTFEDAHEKGVIAISIHPSGKLAMSIGEDKHLKTWNLIKGRKGFVTNLKAVPDSIQFSPEGTLYAVGVSNRVDIYSLATAKVIYSIPFGKRASCLCFKDENILFVAGDQESVEVHSVTDAKKLSSFSAHKVRVKDMKYMHQLETLVTASNDGFIKLWRFPKEETRFSNPPTLLTEVDTTCRIICLAVWTNPNQEEEETDEEEEIEEEEEVDEREETDDDEENQRRQSDEKEETDEENEEPEVPVKKRRKTRNVK